MNRINRVHFEYIKSLQNNNLCVLFEDECFALKESFVIVIILLLFLSSLCCWQEDGGGAVPNSNKCPDDQRYNNGKTCNIMANKNLTFCDISNYRYFTFCRRSTLFFSCRLYDAVYYTRGDYIAKTQREQRMLRIVLVI